jgi:transcription elongation factor GreA
MLAKTTVLTPEGKAKLQAELDHLTGVRRREVAERIHQAMEFSGDPVDNSEYQDAKDEQAFVEGRIRELTQILANSVVMAAESQEAGMVQVGCTVTVEDERGERDTFTLVGSTEASPFEGRYSLDSPVGRALQGHRVGETVVVSAPAGDISYTIVTVSSKARA